MKTFKNTHAYNKKNRGRIYNPVAIATDFLEAINTFNNFKNSPDDVDLSPCEYQFFSNTMYAEEYASCTGKPFVISELSLIRLLKRLFYSIDDISYDSYYKDFPERLSIGKELMRMFETGELK